jgi:hypothetical protein
MTLLFVSRFPWPYGHLASGRPPPNCLKSSSPMRHTYTNGNAPFHIRDRRGFSLMTRSFAAVTRGFRPRVTVLETRIVLDAAFTFAAAIGDTAPAADFSYARVQARAPRPSRAPVIQPASTSLSPSIPLQERSSGMKHSSRRRQVPSNSVVTPMPIARLPAWPSIAPAMFF